VPPVFVVEVTATVQVIRTSPPSAPSPRRQSHASKEPATPLTLSADDSEELLKRLDGFGPGVDIDWRSALASLELDDEVEALLSASPSPGDALVALWHVLTAARRDRDLAWEKSKQLERRLAETESKLEMARAASAQMRLALLLTPQISSPTHKARPNRLDSIVASVLGSKKA
jgi:hypothetical protein